MNPYNWHAPIIWNGILNGDKINFVQLNHISITQTENYLKDLDQDSKDDAIKTAFE